MGDVVVLLAATASGVAAGILFGAAASDATSNTNVGVAVALGTINLLLAIAGIHMGIP